MASRRPYSVLLPVGFAMPPPLPSARCALTAPFHPYRSLIVAAAVCFLWHCPWVRTRRMLSGTTCPRSPDFPLWQPFGFAAAAVRPTDIIRHGHLGPIRQGSRAGNRGTGLRIKAQSAAWRFAPARRSCAGVPGWQEAPAVCFASTDRHGRRRVRGGNGAGRR